MRSRESSDGGEDGCVGGDLRPFLRHRLSVQTLVSLRSQLHGMRPSLCRMPSSSERLCGTARVHLRAAVEMTHRTTHHTRKHSDVPHFRRESYAAEFQNWSLVCSLLPLDYAGLILEVTRVSTHVIAITAHAD